ncbi:hypothetical protein BDV93DRAFT_605407 [Ceratobasidium sp. AG-I]|nr:hypothetical protein BDV93DRAFT_605407 [Ceratobasidium sp. AG-I]
MSLPPWDQQTFSFGWEPYVHTIQQCSRLNIAFSNDLGSAPRANPPPAPPYTVIVYRGGSSPLTLAVGNMGQQGSYPWVVNLAMGPMYMLAMKDSAGYTGGIAEVGDDYRQRMLAISRPDDTLVFGLYKNWKCGQVNIVVNNGTSPFQVEIIPEVRQQKTLHFATNEFGFVLDLPAGLYFFVAITDADGNSGVDGLLTVGSSSDNSCLNAAATVSVGMATSVYSGSGILLPSSTLAISSSSATDQPTTTSVSGDGAQQSSTSTGGNSSNVPIIAGVVAGVVTLAAVTLLICWLLRRRRTQRAMVEPVDDRPKPDMGHIQPYGYVVPHSNTQYPREGVPEIHSGDLRTGMSGYPGGRLSSFDEPRRQSHEAFSHQFQQDITVHAPQPQSYPSGQSILLNSPPSSDQQSPASNRFSQSTGMSAPPNGKGGRVSSEASSSRDRKERVGSPLPPGAMAPAARNTTTPIGSSSIIEPPSSPGSERWFSGPGSPMTRSETVPPPYREQPSRSHFHGSIAE